MLLARAAALLLAVPLTACSWTDFETDDCTETEIEIGDVSASRPEDLRLTARLTTEDGQPVPKRSLDFMVRDEEDGATEQFGSATTDPMGTVQVDLYAQVVKTPWDDVRAKIKTARFLYVEYSNPDAFRSAEPNYCSSFTTVPFRYDGPLPPPTGRNLEAG